VLDSAETLASNVKDGSMISPSLIATVISRHNGWSLQFDLVNQSLVMLVIWAIMQSDLDYITSVSQFPFATLRQNGPNVRGDVVQSNVQEMPINW
jgi:hypothetical protein